MEELTRDQFTDILRIMPEGKGIKLDKDKKGSGNLEIALLVTENLVDLSKNESLFHIIGMWARPWVGYFCNHLEYEYFEPETPANQEFEFRIFKWKNILWAVVSIPISKKDLAYETAEVSHVRLANGVPVMAGGDRLRMLAATRDDGGLKGLGEFFPLNCERAFTLENQKNDVVYEGPGGRQDAKASENLALHNLWGKHGVPDSFDGDDPWEGS
jgi:hypothetical protein